MKLPGGGIEDRRVSVIGGGHDIGHLDRTARLNERATMVT